MRKYRVIGNCAVFDTAPGEVFEADLDEFDERRLVDGGHIAAEGKATAATDKKEG